MKCDTTQNLLYELISGSLQGNDLREAQKHLERCEQCRREAGQLGRTLTLLDELKPPPLSDDFQETVLNRVQDLPLPPQPLWKRIKKHVMPYLTPSLTPAFMKGLAVAVVLLVTATIFIPGILPEKKTHWRDIDIKLRGVTTPILIETTDSEQALEHLKEMIYAHNGDVLQTIEVEQGFQVLFSVQPEEESALLNELSSLGNVVREQEGYKDSEGNIGVVLQEKG